MNHTLWDDIKKSKELLDAQSKPSDFITVMRCTEDIPYGTDPELVRQAIESQELVFNSYVPVGKAIIMKRRDWRNIKT
jgi:hypothetical protein